MGNQEPSRCEAAWTAWLEKNKNEFCRLVWPHLFRYAKSLGLTVKEAEDVVQDVLLAVCHKGFPEWVKDAHLMTKYLFSSVRNRAQNVIMRRRNHLSIEGSQASGDDDSARTRIELADHRLRPDQQYDLSEMRDDLNVLMMQLLLPEEQEVLFLRFVDDLKLQEIASMLGHPLGTVSSRIQRALHKLKEELSRRGFGGDVASN